LIAIGIFILAFSFMIAGRVEQVIFDRHKRLFQIRKTNIVCYKTEITYRLADIKCVKAVKSGHDGINVNTLHYKIVIEFNNAGAVKILESQNESKIVKQVALIKNFIGQASDEECRVIDETSRM